MGLWITFVVNQETEEAIDRRGRQWALWKLHLSLTDTGIPSMSCKHTTELAHHLICAFFHCFNTVSSFICDIFAHRRNTVCVRFFQRGHRCNSSCNHRRMSWVSSVGIVYASLIPVGFESTFSNTHTHSVGNASLGTELCEATFSHLSPSNRPFLLWMHFRLFRAW